MPTSIERDGSAGRVGSSNVALAARGPGQSEDELLDREMPRVRESIERVPAQTDGKWTPDRDPERDPDSQRRPQPSATLDRTNSCLVEADPVRELADGHLPPAADRKSVV